MGLSPPLENIWEITDDLWERIEPILRTADPPKATGRKRVDQRRMIDGVVYKMRSGCQWNKLPKELGDDSTIHRAYQRWMRLGVFAQVWAMVEESHRQGGGRGPDIDFRDLMKSPKSQQAKTGGSHSRRAS